MKINKKFIYSTIAFIVLVFSFFRSQSSPPQTPPEFYLVTKVVDGDTIEVQINDKTETIRYIGIDTPELSSEDRYIKCYVLKAKIENEKLTKNKKVRLGKDISNTDKYNRLLRYV